MKIIAAILAFSMMGSESRSEPTNETKASLDETFRIRVIDFYQSERFTTTDFQSVHDHIAEIAQSVYGPHAAQLKTVAETSFLKIPKLHGDQIVRVVSPVVLPVSELMKSDKNAGDALGAFLATGQGGIAYLNNLDLQSACRMAVQMVVTHPPSKAELVGKRTILCGFAKDRVYRLNDDFLHPSIAIDSLGEWFLVSFDWMEQGFYFPNHIEWHKKGEPIGTGQPATRPVDKPEGGNQPQSKAEGRCP